MQVMKVLTISIDEKALVKCSKCGREEEHLKAVQNGWNVYVFHDKHLCPDCQK